MKSLVRECLPAVHSGVMLPGVLLNDTTFALSHCVWKFCLRRHQLLGWRLLSLFFPANQQSLIGEGLISKKTNSEIP